MIKLKPGQMLITLSVILVAFMIVFSSWISDVFGKTVGYIASNLVYWFVFGIPVAAFLLKSSGAKIADMYVTKHRIQHSNLYNILAFLPVIATCFIVFVPTVQNAPAMAILIAFIYAVINGAIHAPYRVYR